jgi:hypothetical protein
MKEAVASRYPDILPMQDRPPEHSQRIAIRIHGCGDSPARLTRISGGWPALTTVSRLSLPVQPRVAGRQILFLAHHLAHHGIHTVHGVFGRKDWSRVLA